MAEPGAAGVGEADLEMNRGPAPSSPFGLALQAHRQGRFDEADALYRQVAPADPRYADALHLRGLLRHQRGQDAEALPHIEAALRQRPNHALAWSSRGAVLARLNRPADALASFERALALKPDFAEALNNRGNVLRDLERPEAALASYDRALALQPDYVQALNNRGNALRDLKRPAEALASYDRALALEPDFAEILDNRGNALRDLGRLVDALASYDRALALKPDYVAGWINRGNALKDLGRPDQALASYDRALARNPNLAEAFQNRGAVLRDLKRPETALASFDRALALKPDYVEALHGRGAVLIELRRPQEALASLDRALDLRPDSAETLVHRGNALLGLGRFDEALASYDRALAFKPDSVETLNNRGNALRDLGRLEEAVASYDRALALKPDYVLGLDNKGITLIELGRFEAAEASISRAIDLAPQRTRGYYDLTLLPRHWAPDDRYLRAMEDLAGAVDSLAPEEQIDLHFALGKVLADTVAPDRAFRHLILGNAVKRRSIAYDEAAALTLLDRTRSSYTAGLIRDRSGTGAASPVPIFILGMPRSGTSLVEQILASHPDVFGAGEADEFARAAAASDPPVRTLLRTPEAVAALPDAALHRLGVATLSRLALRAPPGCARITDKTLWNFHWAGLIHLALPNARLIHTRRDPVDTCVSCFAQLFAGDLPFAYDLGELGRYYRGYEALMAHWRDVLPPGVLLDIDYEALVADPEAATRRMLAHCGLGWEPRCLDFHRTERPVRTASMTQVRRPIYRSAIGRWRAYESFLQPLLDALGPSAAACPE
jgi:tetratricopeptide (TPR) repeat protein